MAEDGRVRVFRALHEIAVAVGGVLEPAELARLVAERALELLDGDAVGLYILDEPDGDLRPLYSSDARHGSPEPNIPSGRGAAGRAFLLGEPVVVPNYAAWPYAGPWAKERGVRAALAVPLQVVDRRIGALSVRTYSSRDWSEEDAQTLTLLAAQVAPALEAARLYERTRTARVQAEAAIRLRDEVLAGVSHDLSGPLSRIRLYAELLQSEVASIEPASTAEQLVTWSRRIVDGTSMMKSIIQELIDVARLQMGQALQLDCADTDLVALARRAVTDHQQDGRLLHLETSLPYLNGWWDAPRLMRVIGNLLDNALKYSPPHTDVVVQIDRARMDDRLWAELTVTDQGLGIPATDLPRVFDRFYRASNVAETTIGSGLGLFVARQIVELHAGKMTIEQRPGGGTLVKLCLPLEGPGSASDYH